MLDKYSWVLFLMLVAAAVCALLIVAHRFARRRRREGAWNAEGPVHPTQPPPDWLLPSALRGHQPTIESDDVDPSQNGVNS